MYTVERLGFTIQTFDNADAWQAWMHLHAIRKLDGTGRDPDVAIDPDGKRWVQLGYILVPEGEV